MTQQCGQSEWRGARVRRAGAVTEAGGGRDAAALPAEAQLGRQLGVLERVVRQPLLEVEAQREQHPACARLVALARAAVRLEEPPADRHARSAAAEVPREREVTQQLVREP